VGQTFIADCARNTEALIPDREIKTNYELSDEDWNRLGENTSLLHAVRTERERRVKTGGATREAAQRHFAAPTVLNEILTNRLASPRHRIEAAKELRQLATNGSDTTSNEEKFVLIINLGADTIRCGETVNTVKPSPADDGNCNDKPI
jgi:hypothetical protein